MDVFGVGHSTTAIFFFFVVVFPLGIVAEVVDRPNWNKADWERELEIVRQKYYSDVKGGADGPIPELIECALNAPKNFPPCSDRIRRALQNEILVRKQFKSYNEDCDSGEINLSDVPIWSAQNFREYYVWQEKVINSKLKFCNPFKYLRCSAGRKCVCVAGSVWSPPNEVRPVRHKNTCVIPHHRDCTVSRSFFSVDFKDGEEYFDPFKTRGLESQRTVHLLTPGCLEKDDECGGDFQISYFKGINYCINGSIPAVTLRRIHDYFFQAHSAQLLDNDECHFQDHSRLYTSSKEEDENLEVRIKTLEDFVSRGTKFCALQKFMTCGPSGRCECMPPSFRQDDKCVLQEQFDNCRPHPTLEPILMNKTIVFEAKIDLFKGFISATVKACTGQLTCQADSDMMEMYCACRPGKTGRDCEEQLTRFLSVIRIASLPSDVEGYPEKVKIFSSFNNKAVEFEKFFSVLFGSPCDRETQKEAEILVWGIRKLKYRGTNMTKGQYEDLSNRIHNFTTANQNTGGICSLTGMCQYSTKKCVHQTRRDYLQDLVNELEKFKTRKCARPDCSKFPKDFDDVKFGANETQFYGGDHEMEYIRIIEELSRLFKTCDCQVSKMNNTKMTQSFARNCHLPNRFIFLVSIATLFVLSN